MPALSRAAGFGARALHHADTIILAIILAAAINLVVLPVLSQEVRQFFGNVGWSWPFFVAGCAFLLWVLAAWLLEQLAGRARARLNRKVVGEILDWLKHAAPTVGLMTTFMALAVSMDKVGASGGGADVAAGISGQLGKALGSTLAGVGLALAADLKLRLIMRGHGQSDPAGDLMHLIQAQSDSIRALTEAVERLQQTIAPERGSAVTPTEGHRYPVRRKQGQRP